MGLKKFLKKVKKTIKKAVNLNPLIPGSKAQKKLSDAAKKGIPVVAALGGAPAINAATQSALNILPTSITQPGGFFDDIGNALAQARKIAEQLSGGTPSAAPPLPTESEAPKGLNPNTVLIGAAVVLGVVVLARRR